MDVLKDKLAIATADQEITIFDVRNLNKPFQKSHSNLRTLFRCIKILPTLDGFAYGTVEGRASVDSFIVNDEPLFKRYAFKCHRQFYNGYDHVYPVNAIEFHTEGTFITAGGDGTISTWCPKQRKKMRTFQYYPTSISSVAFTADGEYMAVASSYTFEEGEKDHPPDAIYIQSVAPIDFVSDKTKLNNERSTISDDNSIAA
jgi:cell cycle arrest protein BUB3